MREVIAGLLWIGNAHDSRDVRGVLDKEIQAVIDLAAEEPAIVFPREIVYCRFPLLDGAGNDPSVLQAAIDVIARFIESRTPTLVACSGGMSRSPALVAAALSRSEKTSFASALRTVVANGPCDIAPRLLKEVSD